MRICVYMPKEEEEEEKDFILFGKSSLTLCYFHTFKLNEKRRTYTNYWDMGKRARNCANNNNNNP